MRHSRIISFWGAALFMIIAASPSTAASPEPPEMVTARRLDRETQFELRLGRSDVAREKMEIAEWLAPNVNRQSMLVRIISIQKGKSNDQN